MTEYEIADILDGCALLERCGNLYEYAGMDGERYIFQNVNDDSWVAMNYEALRHTDWYTAVY